MNNWTKLIIKSSHQAHQLYIECLVLSLSPQIYSSHILLIYYISSQSSISISYSYSLSQLSYILLYIYLSI